MMYRAEFYEVSKCFEEATGREWAVWYQLKQVLSVIDSDADVV
jgi:hypothetical protein